MAILNGDVPMHGTNLERLKVLQKRVIKIITKSKLDAHTEPIFKQDKLLNINNFFKLQAGLLCSPFITECFQNNSNLYFKLILVYILTKLDRPSITGFLTNIRKFTIVYQGPKFWNSLPIQLKQNSSRNSFKINLKKHLLSL